MRFREIEGIIVIVEILGYWFWIFYAFRIFMVLDFLWFQNFYGFRFFMVLNFLWF